MVHKEQVGDVRALPADVVVIAGGAWTGKIGRNSTWRCRSARCAARSSISVSPDYDTARWPIVQPVFGYYLVPWADHRVAVGATVEDVGFNSEVTAGGVHEVLRETLRVLPGLTHATLREVRVGLRPCSADDSPIIGALPGS